MPEITSGPERHDESMRPKLNVKRQLEINALSGLFAGMGCAALFNPIDQALYLSVKHKRPFLLKANFCSPYRGLPQAIVQRAFLNGIYYTLQGEMKTYVSPWLRNELGASEVTAQFVVGMGAGGLSGAMCNSISAVKYHMWNHEGRAFFSSVGEMWLHGGFTHFVKGTRAVIARDVVFGPIYEVVRGQLRTHVPVVGVKGKNSYMDFACNSVAAGFATLASSPFNYAKNMQYATCAQQKPPTISNVLEEVWQESKGHGNYLARAGFFQRRFVVGWGTIRSAVGMAVGQEGFDRIQEKLTDMQSMP